MLLGPRTVPLDSLAEHPNGAIEFGRPLLHLRRLFRTGRPLVDLTAVQQRAVDETNEAILRREIRLEALPCLCGGLRFRPLADVDRYGILQRTALCKSCGLIQCNPRMSEDAYQSFYESDTYRRLYEGGDSPEVWAERFYADRRGIGIFERVTAQRPIAQIKSVAELGAGGGWNLAAFAAAGIEVAGCDYSPALVAFAQRRGIPLVQGSIERLTARHDVVIANQVVEHLMDPVATLRELAGRLNDDGLLFVAVPDIEAFGVLQLQSAHTYYFSRQTFMATMREAGFARVYYERDNPPGVQAGIFVQSDEPTAGGDPPGEHARAMARMLRRYELSLRLAHPLAAARGLTRTRPPSADGGVPAEPAGAFSPLE